MTIGIVERQTLNTERQTVRNGGIDGGTDIDGDKEENLEGFRGHAPQKIFQCNLETSDRLFR